jgi:hypothetical protein
VSVGAHSCIVVVKAVADSLAVLRVNPAFPAQPRTNTTYPAQLIRLWQDYRQFVSTSATMVLEAAVADRLLQVFLHNFLGLAQRHKVDRIVDKISVLLGSVE